MSPYMNQCLAKEVAWKVSKFINPWNINNQGSIRWIHNVIFIKTLPVKTKKGDKHKVG